MRGIIKNSLESFRGILHDTPFVFRIKFGRLIIALFLLTLSYVFNPDVCLSKEVYLSAWQNPIEGKSLLSDYYRIPETALFDSVHSFDALHYRLDLNFPMQNDYYSGAVTLRLRVVDNGLSEIRLNMVGLIADTAFSVGFPAAFNYDDTSIVISLNGIHPIGETLSVKICYHDTLAGRGYYNYPRNSYTMAEPQDARRWFPCYDEPWDKASSEIYATVPESFKVGSNGYLAGIENHPASHTSTYHWVNDSPISTYLINLIMGDFATWNDYYINPQGDSIPIFYMVWREDSTAAAYDFATIPAMIGVYSQLFYPYPFVKYGQGAVSPFAFGGMEHQTMTTINRNWITGDRSIEEGYAHELAHMWWGDLVTLADWRHIWLNEGFATYSAALFNEAFHGETLFANEMAFYKDNYFLFEQNAGRFPHFNTSPDLFAYSEYIKGAWVLHMLRGIVGDQAFFAGLHQYATQYAYSNASTWEFRDIMESISGLDLDWFFQEWIFDQGYPEYNYAWSYQTWGDDFIVHLEIEQIQTNAPIYRMPLKIRVHSGVNYDFTIQNDQRIQSYDFTVLTTPTDLVLDPDGWVLMKSHAVASIDTSNEALLPEMIKLENIYPNPFNSSANIAFSIEGKEQTVELVIYDIEGRQERRLQSGILGPGHYVIRWDGRGDSGEDLSSGIYLVRLSAPGKMISRKITFIK
jgi:aminopeptidase N